MRRHIAKELKDVALHLSITCGLSDERIKHHTGISVRSLKRLRQTYRETGQTVRVPATCGRPRRLTASEAQFLEECIRQEPDLSLMELRQRLLDVYEVDVSIMTVWRTLKRRGCTKEMLKGESAAARLPGAARAERPADPEAAPSVADASTVVPRV
ncbi:hypothetical protein C8Q80DRAFT_1265692 [Daedaleopsis nitida]|nr:hypothetical protein C8Q80DRAFT_1265692 [Daedaleopsis nitida]